MNISDFNKISSKYGNFNIEELLKYNSRIYSIYKYDSKKCLILLDGLIDDKLDKLIISNSRDYKDIWAGYKYLETLDIKYNVIDVFLLSEKLLLEKDFELKELLVFHEICHFLEKSALYKTLGINLREFDFLIGGKIQDIADDLADKQGLFQDLDHNETFGAILNYFFDKYNSVRRHELLGKSMIKNFIDDYSERMI